MIALLLWSCAGSCREEPPTGDSGGAPCVLPLSAWDGERPSSVEEGGAACLAGGYTTHGSGATTCDLGAVVTCAGSTSLQYGFDADGELVSVLRCSDVPEFCGEGSRCVTYGEPLPCG